MWVYQAGEINSPIPCHYTKELRAFTQEIIDRIPETATQDTFVRCQQSLLSRYRDLAERMQKNIFHFPTARTGRHWCLHAEYEQAYHRLKNLALMYDPPPPPPEPAPTPQPLSDEDLMERLKDYVAERAKETFFGQEQEAEQEDGAEESA